MKFIIRHESDKRMRVHFAVSRMTYKEADILLYFLNNTKISLLQRYMKELQMRL